MSVAGSCRRAQQFLVHGKYQQALDVSKQALRLDPQSAEANDLAGQAELAIGNLNASQRYLERSLKLQPERIDAHRALGIVLLRKKLYGKAQHEFERVLSSRPNDFTSRYSMGVSLLLQNRPARALKEFFKARQLNSSSIVLLTSMLEAYLKLNQETEASSTLAELDRRLSDHDADRMRLAAFLVSQKFYDLSVEEFERLKEDHPNSLDLSYDLALAYHKAGRQADAAALLRKVLSQREDPELENLLGDVEQKAGKQDAAVAAFKRAMELAPKDEDYRYDYAQSLENSGELDEALQVFAAGINDNPQAVKLWLGLGGSYYLAGRYDKAVQVLLHASQIAPRAPEPYVLLGVAYDAAGPLQKTIAEQFSRYLANNPRDASAHYYYGKILLEKNSQGVGTSLRMAYQHLEEAVKLDPRLAEAHIELGILLNREGQEQAARKELELAVSLDPRSNKAYYTLAQVYRKLGQHVQAQEALQKFEQLKANQNQNQDQQAVKDFLARPKGTSR